MTTHLVGEQFGDYRLIRLIGRGGFANVYLGEHCRRKTLAAVKVLNTRLANNNVKSFRNEARSIRLRHPNIVQILDFGLEDDFPFLVMEYAPYGSLRQRYPKGTQLKPGTVCIYVRQIADALQYAHNEGVVHRYIKPSNLGGRVFVDVPTTPFQEHTKKKKIEERPTIPKSGFQLPGIGLPFSWRG